MIDSDIWGSVRYKHCTEPRIAFTLRAEMWEERERDKPLVYESSLNYSACSPVRA